jgi:hypothetical protein
MRSREYSASCCSRYAPSTGRPRDVSNAHLPLPSADLGHSTLELSPEAEQPPTVLARGPVAPSVVLTPAQADAFVREGCLRLATGREVIFLQKPLHFVFTSSESLLMKESGLHPSKSVASSSWLMPSMARYLVVADLIAPSQLEAWRAQVWGVIGADPADPAGWPGATYAGTVCGARRLKPAEHASSPPPPASRALLVSCYITFLASTPVLAGDEAPAGLGAEPSPSPSPSPAPAVPLHSCASALKAAATGLGAEPARAVRQRAEPAGGAPPRGAGGGGPARRRGPRGGPAPEDAAAAPGPIPLLPSNILLLC